MSTYRVLFPPNKSKIRLNTHTMVEFSLFELVGLGDVSGIDMLFASSALIGGILFVLYFFLLMIGGIATDIFDGLFGIDVDMGADASFKALTFQGIMAFLMFFGLAGLYVTKSGGGPSPAILAGAIAGGPRCTSQASCSNFSSTSNRMGRWNSPRP